MTLGVANLDQAISRSNPLFCELSQSQQRLALHLLRTNREFLVNDLSTILYDNKPVPVHQFLSKDVMGGFAESIFPTWRRELSSRIFAPGSLVKEVVFSGATGIGKSTAGMLCLLYNLYRVLCFKYPHKVMGVSTVFRLAEVVITADLNLATREALDPFMNLLRTCSFFEEVPKLVDVKGYVPGGKFPFCLKEAAIYFPKGILFFAGSKSRHSLGSSLIGGMLDEAEYRTCLFGATPIKLLDGTARKIEDLVGKGFSVYSFDLAERRVVIGRAGNCRRTGVGVPVVRVSLDNGCSFTCTKDHLWLLKSGTYVNAGDLVAGDSLRAVFFTLDGLVSESRENHKVVAVEACGFEDVYDLEVENYHNFTVACPDGSGVIVHNSADSVGEAMNIYTGLKERIKTRFLDKPWVMQCLVSSARHEEGVIPEYVETIPVDSKEAVVYSFAVWDVRDFESYKDGKKFLVFKGNKTLPSRILSDSDAVRHRNGLLPVMEGCEVIEVPEAHRQSFVEDVERALRNVAGRVTVDSSLVFLNGLESFQRPDESLCPELNLTATLGDPRPLINQLPATLASSADGVSFLPARAPLSRRYVHIDLAEASGSEAGLSVAHKEIGERGATYVVVDFAARLSSPKRIDVMSVCQLVIDLHDLWGFEFQTVTADQYQSTFLVQRLKVLKAARNSERLSVDRTTVPYSRTAPLVARGFLKIGHCPTVLEQAKAVKIVKGKVVTRYRKDILDSVVGATHNALSDINMPEYVYVTGRLSVPKSDAAEKKIAFEEV